MAVLGDHGIFVWDGNYYALAVTERLGLEGKDGMVRIGAVHAGEAPVTRWTRFADRAMHCGRWLDTRELPPPMAMRMHMNVVLSST